MKPNFVANVMFSVLFGMLAIPLLAVGIRGLKARRPFLTSMRLPLLMMLVYCISLLLLLLFFSISNPILVVRWTPLLLSACSLLMLCYSMKGYLAFGVTYTPFRQVLMTTLEKLQLSYEEPFSLRRLKSPLSGRVTKLKLGEVELRMWMGALAVHLQVNHRLHYPLLREIVDTMDEYFRTSTVRTNLTPFVLHVILAVLLLAVGVMFFSGSF